MGLYLQLCTWLRKTSKQAICKFKFEPDRSVRISALLKAFCDDLVLFLGPCSALQIRIENIDIPLAALDLRTTRNRFGDSGPLFAEDFDGLGKVQLCQKQLLGMRRMKSFVTDKIW